MKPNIIYMSLPLLFATAVQAEEQRPNVLFFLVDDLGWCDLGYSGSDLHQTPNIDALSQDGVVFTQAYSACTVSSPTRASIVTGKYPASLHLTDWIGGWAPKDKPMVTPDWQKYLDLDEVTMSEIFKANDYNTVHIGKWHLGKDEKYGPIYQGFDSTLESWSNDDPRALPSDDIYAPYGYNKGHITEEQIAEEACKYLDNRGDDPFFMYLCFYGVHTPVTATMDKLSKYQSLIDESSNHTNPVYASLCERVDDTVGSVISKLKELGLYDNTIIVFTSDNGGLLQHKGNKMTSNYPLRDGKGSIYEGGVRVPLIIKSSDGSERYTNTETPVISIDYLPTLVDMAKLEVDRKVSQEWHGVSLRDLVERNKTKLSSRSLYWHYPHYHFQGAVPHSAIRDDKWRLVYIIEEDRYELYDLEKDISETTDLASTYPKVVKRLSSELNSWLKDIDAQIPERNPKYKTN